MPVDASIIPQRPTLPDFNAPMSIMNLLQKTQNEQLQGQKLQQEVNQNQPELNAQLTRGQILNNQLETLAKQNNFWGQKLGGLKSLEDKITYNDIQSALSEGLALKQIDPNQALEYHQQIQANKDKPAELKKWVDQHFVSTRSNEQQLNALLPKINYVDTGNGISITKTSPLTGSTEIQGIIPKNLSPAELAQTVEVKTPEGKTEIITKGQLLNLVNNSGGTWNVGKQVNTPEGYTGRYPNAETKSPQMGTHGGVISGLSPAEQSAQTALGTSQAGAVQSLSNFASGAPQRIMQLEKARELLGEGTTTGAGTEWRNTARSFIGSLAPDVAEKAFGKNFNANTASYEEFRKLMTNYANNASSQLGTGTNDRLNAAITGNANPNIQTLANQDILTMTVAAEKMMNAQNKAWQASGKNPTEFNKWQAEFNSHKFLPESFVYESMTGKQQAEFKKRMEEKKQWGDFQRGFVSLVKQGLIEPPKGQ